MIEAVAGHPPAMYVIMAVPTAPPVMFPEASTPTTPGLLLLHVPPPVASLNVFTVPGHNTVEPVMADGPGLTVIEITLEFAVGTVRQLALLVMVQAIV